MAYSVDLIYSKNQDLSNPSTETESGQPSEIELMNLDANQRYYTKAVLKNDGVTEDESDIETFQTLQAGSITLTFGSTVRNNNNYIVTYTVSSTYALSSAILSTNNTNFQGAISGNTIVFTVSGLTHGDAYLYSVNAIDIYAESGTANGTITTTVVNTVYISDVDENETDVTCYMTYTIDSGFTQAWVEYWNENDDPSTDQPQGHNTFTEGETSCTLYNLAPGTTYQFRATIYYGGYVNYVVSNVVRATTKLPSDIDPLSYIHNSYMQCNTTPVPIDTGIPMTSNTSFRIKGMYKGLGTGYYTVGTDTYEFNEMRLFMHIPSGCQGSCIIIYDLYSSRTTDNQPYYSDGDIFDLTCGNYYVYDNISQSYIYNLTALSYNPIGTIKINVGQIWVSSFEIVQNNATVFNGVAAHDSNLDAYGLYDTVSQTLFTNSNASIVGEE